MKVLSIRQPWAWLIVHGHKDIENRTWSTSYRGRFLIHAGKAMSKSEYLDCHEFAESLGVQIPPHAELERGGLSGTGCGQKWSCGRNEPIN